MSYARQLREILAREKTVLVPGAHDAFSAKIYKQAGFEIIYMTGSGVTGSLIGMPDVGLLTMTEMVSQARNIVNAVDLPVICDADNGYGNPINVIRTVREYEQAGVAGIHIEDQVAPKRCGHFEGKQVIPAEEMARKVEAALYARRDDNFLIIARTDARSVAGFEESLRRVRLYQEAGADMLFVESPQSVEELRIIGETFEGVPLLVNMVEGGKTPVLPFEELKAMGFTIVLYPTAAIRAAGKALKDLATHLSRYKNTKEFEDRLIGFTGRNEVTGLALIEELERRFVASKGKS
jgi:carboxyvinyl-carboxyphosphonate phosphorylmutase